MHDADRRVKFTKMVLRESLLELMREKPIGEITVTELCKNAAVYIGVFAKLGDGDFPNGLFPHQLQKAFPKYHFS